MTVTCTDQDGSIAEVALDVDGDPGFETDQSEVTITVQSTRTVRARCVDDASASSPEADLEIGVCSEGTSPVLIDVPVDQVVRITPAGQPTCLLMPPSDKAEYVVAYADRRLIDQALSEPEWPWPDSITVVLDDRTTGIGNATEQRRMPPSFVVAEVERPDYVAGTGAFLSEPDCSEPAKTNVYAAFCRQEPWAVGDTFTIQPRDRRPPGLARVLVVRDPLVFAVFEADESALAPSATARVTAAFDYANERVLPFLRAAYGTSRDPTTSDGSGQLIVFAQLGTPTAYAAAWVDQPDRGRWAMIGMPLNPNGALAAEANNVGSLVNVLAHEATHTYQFLRRYESGEWNSVLGSLWAVEGSATFVGRAMARELNNIGFLTNMPREMLSVTDDRFPLTAYWSIARNVTQGYHHTAGFLRDMVQRLMVDGGQSFEEAVSIVLLGALEGWHGINEDSSALGPGLTHRMRNVLGPDWEPVDALLTWTLTAAVDDRTGNDDLQNLTIEAGHIPNIIPDSEMDAGAGESLSVLRGPGTTGVVVVRMSGSAKPPIAWGHIVLDGAVGDQRTDALEWLLVRLR